jgi:integrase
VKRKELKRFLRDLVAQGAPSAILLTLARIVEPESRDVIATQDELARLQAVAGAWEKCLLAMLSGLGLRRNEAIRLSPANYNPETRMFTYRTKGGKTNRLPATDELRAFVELIGPDIEDPNVPILTLLAGKKIGKHCVDHAWDRLRIRARVNPGLRMHDLRRTVATAIYDKTHDLRLASHLLGHKSLSTTLKYLRHTEHRDISPLLNEHRDLPDASWKN